MRITEGISGSWSGPVKVRFKGVAARSTRILEPSGLVYAVFTGLGFKVLSVFFFRSLGFRGLCQV